MNAIKALEERLHQEGPAYTWNCVQTIDPDHVEVTASCKGKKIDHSPVLLTRETIARMGVDSTAWLICHEFSAKRVGVDWDKLAEL